MIIPDPQTLNLRPPDSTQVAAALAYPSDCELLASDKLMTDRRYRAALPARAWVAQWIAVHIAGGATEMVDPELVTWIRNAPRDQQLRWVKNSLSLLASCSLEKLSLPTAAR